jgi:hypothetical protein
VLKGCLLRYRLNSGTNDGKGKLEDLFQVCSLIIRDNRAFKTRTAELV